MSWRLRIEHTTKVVYTGLVRTSFNEARMTPLTLPTQTTLESRVTAGSGVPVWTYNDYWGTHVSVFDLPDPHDDLVFQAISMVEPDPCPGVPAAGTRPGWPERRRHAGEGRLLEFVLPTALTTVTEEISDAAIADIAAGRSGPDEAAAAISARVHDHVTYLPGATGVRTNAQEAWEKGQGVCQDMAQIAVSLLRAAGPPATSPATCTPTRRRSPAARRSASRTPGSSTGPARGRRSTPPAAPPSASATSPSPAAATTPTARRSRASTTARPTATCRSRSRSPASPNGK